MKYYKLKDLCTDIIDCPHSTPDWQSEGIRVVRNFNLKNGNLDFTDGYFVDEETYQNRIKRAVPEEDDIIISREAPMGVVGIVPKKLKCCLGQRLVLLKIDKSKCTPYYLLFMLMSDFVQAQFKRADATGSIVSNLCIPDLKEIVIPMVDKGQDDIAKLLKAINSKMLTNNKINDNLQRQLKLMYDYWFTQFDFPDENGKPYRASGGVMLWNEQLKRNIPAGWTVDNLYAVADYINGLACQNYRPDDDNHKLPVIKITEMHNGITDSTESVRDDIPEKYIIEDGDILFSWSATLETMLWYGGRGGLNQHIFKVVPKCPKYFAYSQLSSYIINFKAIAEARKTTMGHITTDHMEQSRIAIPPTIVQETFNRQVTPLYEQFANNCKENLRLQALRDWLLPMLMNGQATIAD